MRNGLKPDGTRKLPAAPEGMFWASGHNNNKCFVIPEWDMVIYEAQHREYLKYARLNSDRFIAMKNETEKFPRTQPQSRRYMWACAMTGMHTLEAGHDAMKRAQLLADDGRIRTFMEQTDFPTMRSRDELAAGSTKWVLANPGTSYIAYTYDCSRPMGLKELTAGMYDLLWFDTVTGRIVRQSSVQVASSDAAWSKPDYIVAHFGDPLHVVSAGGEIKRAVVRCRLDGHVGHRRTPRVP